MKKIIFWVIILFVIITSPIFATVWYVRPAGGNYGAENGTSYANAWDGLNNVVWGSGGVQAGDNLYVCGLHLRTYTNVPLYDSIFPVSGTDENNRVTIRGDYNGDKGIVWGAGILAHESWMPEGSNTYSITLPSNMYSGWLFEDITASSWTILTKKSSLQECQNSAGTYYSPDYRAGSKLYVHCTDENAPTNRIAMGRAGYKWKIKDLSYITFSNIEFYYVYRTFVDRTLGERIDHIRWDSCHLWYGENLLMDFREGCNYLEFINCDIGWAQNGICFTENTLGGDKPHDYKISGCYIHDMGIRVEDQDAHGMSFQGSYNGLIEKNEFYNCGTTLCAYAYSGTEIKNTIIRWNYVHDTHMRGGANGNGISLSCSGDATDDKTGNKVYGNIVVNTQTAYFCAFEDSLVYYNNVACNSAVDSFHFHRDTYGINVSFKNNISMNPSRYHVKLGFNDIGNGDFIFVSDNNCFYPTAGYTLYFYDNAGGNGELTVTEWQALSRTGCVFDPNSIINNPGFINTSGFFSSDSDFRLQSDSPVIDSGAPVGLTLDYVGTPIPKGFGPDIGAYEYNGGSYPLMASINASPISGTAPLSVSFSGSASGGASPYTYRWNFGDGTSSTAQNPSHTYSNSGTYIAIFIVTDSNSNQTTDSLSISASSATGTTQLLLSAITGGPAPGFGGTTDPVPGSYNYASGSVVSLRAIPNTDYRFSEWEGDVIASEAFNQQFSLNLDTDKDLSAFFCTRCGDVTGDLRVTAADAQGAFDIFLSRNSAPTKCETENADVSCDSTVTPGDAQSIFNKFIMIGELPADCSGKTRALQTQTLSIQKTQLPENFLIVEDAEVNDNGYAYVPIIIDNPSNIDAFGFDLQFPSEFMEFLTFDVTELLEQFYQVDAYNAEEGLLKIGGYSSTPLVSDSSQVLITLVFRVKEEASGPLSLVIVNTYDDIQNAEVKDGTVINTIPRDRNPVIPSERERIIKRFERTPALLFIRF